MFATVSPVGRNVHVHKFYFWRSSQVPRECEYMQTRLVLMLTRVLYLQARIEWLMTLGNEMGGPEQAQAMIKGQGVSLILKSLSIKFKRPVTYPDTVSDLTDPRFDARLLTCPFLA